jgi:hypothetical protein
MRHDTLLIPLPNDRFLKKGKIHEQFPKRERYRQNNLVAVNPVNLDSLHAR